MSAARKALWELVRGELEDIDKGACQMSKHCDSESWALYYEACLSRETRQKEEAKEEVLAQKPPSTPQETDPQLLHLAALIAEQKQLNPGGRSIVINNKISDLVSRYRSREATLDRATLRTQADDG